MECRVTQSRWQLVVVLAGAPLFQGLLFLASGASLETHYRFAFLSGMTTEYIFFAVVLWFLRRNDLHLADVGLSLQGWAVEGAIGIGTGLLLFVAMGILIVGLTPLLPFIQSARPRPPWAAWVYGFALLTAFAPIEEIVWRGYAISALREHMRRFWLSALIASLSFGAMHWWGGWGLVVATAIVGLAYSALYRWRRGLFANIVAHFVSDFPLFLVMVLGIQPPDG